MSSPSSLFPPTQPHHLLNRFTRFGSALIPPAPLRPRPDPAHKCPSGLRVPFPARSRNPLRGPPCQPGPKAGGGRREDRQEAGGPKHSTQLSSKPRGGAPGSSQALHLSPPHQNVRDSQLPGLQPRDDRSLPCNSRHVPRRTSGPYPVAAATFNSTTRSRRKLSGGCVCRGRRGRGAGVGVKAEDLGARIGFSGALHPAFNRTTVRHLHDAIVLRIPGLQSQRLAELRRRRGRQGGGEGLVVHY